jgi:hypothetical protein
MIMKLRNQPYAPKWEQEKEKNIAINILETEERGVMAQHMKEVRTDIAQSV